MTPEQMNMTLAEVIEKEWKPVRVVKEDGKGKGKGKAQGNGKGKGGARALPALANGKGGAGGAKAKGKGKARVRVLRRTNVKGKGAGKSGLRRVAKGSNLKKSRMEGGGGREAKAKGKGRRSAGKGAPDRAKQDAKGKGRNADSWGSKVVKSGKGAAGALNGQSSNGRAARFPGKAWVKTVLNTWTKAAAQRRKEEGGKVIKNATLKRSAYEKGAGRRSKGQPSKGKGRALSKLRARGKGSANEDWGGKANGKGGRKWGGKGAKGGGGGGRNGDVQNGRVSNKGRGKAETRRPDMSLGKSSAEKLVLRSLKGGRGGRKGGGKAADKVKGQDDKSRKRPYDEADLKRMKIIANLDTGKNDMILPPRKMRRTSGGRPSLSDRFAALGH